MILANDSTVKAGSWGKLDGGEDPRGFRKSPCACACRFSISSIRREHADHGPGRNVSRTAGGGPHLLQPKPALRSGTSDLSSPLVPRLPAGAYIPAFCDLVVMVEGNASMYLGSPRMAEMVIGEKVSLEEMGGARMHCTVSGCGDVLLESEAEALDFARRLPELFSTRAAPSSHPSARRALELAKAIDAIPARRPELGPST